MKHIVAGLRRLQLKTFKISYAPEYKTWLPFGVANDPQHPLYILRRRELQARKKEGLWWHVTSGLDLSKSSVVRSWCRRRLRNAFTESMKERGFDEFGRLEAAERLFHVRPELGRILESKIVSGKTISLTGSARMHITPKLVAAKYADVKKETSAIVNVLLDSIQNESYSLHHSVPVDKKTGSRLKALLHGTTQFPTVSKPQKPATTRKVHRLQKTFPIRNVPKSFPHG